MPTEYLRSVLLFTVRDKVSNHVGKKFDHPARRSLTQQFPVMQHKVANSRILPFQLTGITDSLTDFRCTGAGKRLSAWKGESVLDKGITPLDVCQIRSLAIGSTLKLVTISMILRVTAILAVTIARHVVRSKVTAQTKIFVVTLHYVPPNDCRAVPCFEQWWQGERH